MALLLSAACSDVDDSDDAAGDICGQLARPSNRSGAGSAHIAYASDAGGGRGLWLMRPDGSHQTPLVSGDGTFIFPAWSPDGTSLAYTASGGSDLDGADICRISVNDGRVTNLTDTQDTSELAPTWSPDGQQIAYTSSTEDRSTIFVMAADGTKTPFPRRLPRQLQLAELVA